MKNRLTLLSAVLVFFGYFLIGCEGSSDDFDDLDIPLISNIPVSANVANAYSYVINANDFSTENLADLQFDSASFSCALTIANYNGGDLSLAIFSEDSSASFIRDISSSIVIAEIPEFKPRYLFVKMENFSGSMTLAVSNGD